MKRTKPRPHPLGLLSFVLLVVSLLLGLGLALVRAQEDEAYDPENNPITVQVADEGFDRRAMLAHIARNVIIPCNDRFAAEASGLAEALAALHAEADAPALVAAREAWKKTARAWHRCTLYGVGGLELMIIHNQISKVPADTPRLDALSVSAKDLTPEAVASWGSTTKGLPAIEYLLFGGTDTLLGEPRRLELLALLGRDVSAQAVALQEAWDGYAPDFAAADAGGKETQGSLNMLVNEMIAQLQGVVLHKLGEPMGKLSYGEPVPELAQAHYSQDSLAQIRSNLLAYQDVLAGDGGLGSYLDYIGATYDPTGAPLSDELRARADAAIRALDAIGAPLETAVTQHPERVDNLYQAVRMLVILTKVDMGNQMGVTVTFNDTDGD